MIYQHPLAYLLGLEGRSLLRAWAGEQDEAFVHARLAEVRRLLDDPGLAGHPGVRVERADSGTGYRQWADSYDQPNTLFDVEQPVVLEILDRLAPGDALDAACGTGRYAAPLEARGHRVVGVDSSPEMLAHARRRVPAADFRLGDVLRLPVADDAVDVVVCALALSHLPRLEPVLAEFARVLRPGGHLVVSDAHPELILSGSVVHAPGPAGEPGLVATYRHSTGDYLRAAVPLGFVVRRCEEPGAPGEGTAPAPAGAPELATGPWEDWPWTLMALVPEASRAAGHPAAIVWHLQLAGS